MFKTARDRKHVIYDICGIKIKLKLKLDKELYEKFTKHSIAPKTVLIIEINDCHFETIPGYCKYLVDLGYNVDVLTRHNANKIFSNFKLKNVQIFECNEKTFNEIYKKYDFSKYERIIYNSQKIFCGNSTKDVRNYHKKLPNGYKKNIYIQHNIERLSWYPEDLQIILANPAKNQELDNIAVNPNYFGYTAEKNTNSDIVKFISVGRLSARLKDFTSLISTVETLHKTGRKNFKITIIGNGEFENLSDEIKPYFEIMGKVDFSVLFQKLNEADFILTMLNSQKEEHKRYLTNGVSGIFQLIYGFLKPCIVEKTFADSYGFNDDNSIIYTNNYESFVEKMIEALDMSKENYETLQKNLKLTVDKINEKSLDNFRSILNE